MPQLPSRRQAGTINLMKKPWIPYAAPFILFLAITGLGQSFPSNRDIIYIAKTIVVSLLLWFWRRRYTQDITPKLTPAG